MGNDLSKRYGASSSDESSGRKSAFDFSKAGNVKFWKQKEGVNKIDIIPYTVSSKSHPLVHNGTLEKGDLDYTLELWVHTFIGPQNATVVCPKRNYGQPCPICEQSKKYEEEGKEEESKALWAKKKMYYNVQDVLHPGDGVQIFESNFKYFEKPLRSLAKDTDDGSPFIDFADPKKGKTLKFTGEKEKFNGKDFIQFANMKFLDRDEPITPLLKDAVQFDKLIVKYTYEELEAILFGGATDDSEDEDDDDAPPPKPRNSAKEDKAAESDLKDDGEEEAPKKPSKNRCPAGHEYGTDHDKFPDDCKNCPEWKSCFKESLTK